MKKQDFQIATHRLKRGRLCKRCKGQALILGLLFSGVTAVIVLLLFNSAMLTTTKTQLQNAADAGAYSAALLQARDANFSAYTNRAMIANQVAVAQFVSLKSYFDDASQTNKRANSFLQDPGYRFFPSSAPAWDVGVKVPVNTARTAFASISSPAVKALDLLIDALDTAQQINHVGTMASIMLVADDVVKKNDPLAKVSTSAFMLGDAALRIKKWGGDSVKQFSANDSSKESDRFADVVVDRNSTDWFVRNRASIPAPFWVSTVKPCLLATASFTTYGFAHFGGTILSTNKKRWLGLDATMGGGFWTCTYLVPCPVGLCPVTIGFPFPDVGTTAPFLGGSGGSVAGAGGAYKDATGYKNNPFEAKLYGGAMLSPAIVPAQYRYWVQGPGTTLDSGGGLQKHYRDVAAPLTTKPTNQSAEENGGKFPITVEVERTSASIRDTTKFMPGSQQLKLQPQLKGETLRALSSAHAFFYRPAQNDSALFTRTGWQRSDNRTEYQSLFSPYWQARLAPTSLAEQSASALGQ